MSNSWLGLTDPARQQALPKQLQLFDCIFDSSQEKMKKPDSVFYQRVEDGIKSSGEDIFFIDDDKKNIDAAGREDWQTFLYDMGNDRGETANSLLRNSLLAR